MGEQARKELQRNQKLMELSEAWHQKHGPEEPMPATDSQRRWIAGRLKKLEEKGANQ